MLLSKFSDALDDGIGIEGVHSGKLTPGARSPDRSADGAFRLAPWFGTALLQVDPGIAWPARARRTRHAASADLATLATIDAALLDCAGGTGVSPVQTRGNR